MTDALWFVGILAAASGLPPLLWGLRIWAATSVISVAGLILSPKIPIETMGLYDGFGEVVLTLALVGASLGLGLRALVSWAMGRGRGPAVPRWVDLGGAALIGALVGHLATLALALALRGVPGGLGLHLLGVALGLGAGLWAWRRLRGLVRVGLVAAALVLAGEVLLGAFLWPGLITARAAETAKGAPFCLIAGDARATTDQTMLLTLPRGGYDRPGLILVVLRDSGPASYRWSYRARDFRVFHRSGLDACPNPG